MRVLFVCQDFDYWMAHREPMAARLRDKGDVTHVLCGLPKERTAPALPGFTFVPLERHRFDLIGDFRLMRAVRRAAHRFKPDAAHFITVKPVLYGGLALRLTRGRPKRFIGTFAGLGRLFAADAPGISQLLMRVGLRFAYGGSRARLAFENIADRATIVEAGLIDPARTHVLPGAGIPTEAFPAASLPEGLPPEGRLRLLFASRLIKAKGTGLFLDAAEEAQKRGLPVQFIVAGWSDKDPDAVDPARLQALARNGAITLAGHVSPDAMADLIRSVHALVLPTSYNEGLPRIICEAASMGRPAIVSDVPGCRAAVRHDETGIILQDLLLETLLEAVEALGADRPRLIRLGAAAAAHMRQGGFDIADVTASYRMLYAAD
jgi:glycosyltransferase involved in cell wall biosynthesis